MHNLQPDFNTLIQNLLSPAAVAINAADISELEREAELIKAQREHQVGTMGMSFFPIDGRCHRCRARLVDVISEHKLRNENVTGCPLCDTTFID